LVARGPSDSFFLIYLKILSNNICDMPRKLKSQPEPIRTHVSLSFTAPLELEEPMNQAAAAKGMNRSQYICWLVQQDIRFQERNPPQGDGETLLPRVPPRIRRKAS
jgi:hypothetical protein